MIFYIDAVVTNGLRWKRRYMAETSEAEGALPEGASDEDVLSATLSDYDGAYTVFDGEAQEWRAAERLEVLA